MGFIIYLFGPSAAGKSTTADLVASSIPNLDVIDFDVIKRQIPHYDWSKHAQDGKAMTLDAVRLRSATKDKILLLFPAAKSKDEYEMIHSIAASAGHKLINVHITASSEALIERYKHRLAHIDPFKKEWKFKTLDEFIEKINKPYFVPDNTVTLDSSVMTKEDIARRIVELIK